jgi:hypothetical protein
MASKTTHVIRITIIMKTKPNDELYLYILMRTDLPSQGIGRACAQASHATSVLEWNHNRHNDYKQWKAQTQYGYGTTIVLGASKTQITDILACLICSKQLKGWCIDPDYAISISFEVEKFLDCDALKSAGAWFEQADNDPHRLILHRPEKTCAYVLGSKEDLALYLGHLPLYQG